MRAKTIVILASLAAAVAVIVIPTVRQHRKEAAANERRTLDVEIGAYYESTAKPLLTTEAGEPTYVIGKVLPVVIKNSLPHSGSDDYTGTALDRVIFTELDPALRVDRLAEAGTLVFVDDDATAVYAGHGDMAIVRNGLTITLFDPSTRRVLGRKQFAGPELPNETNRSGVEYYGAWQAAQVAAYLKRLPHR